MLINLYTLIRNLLITFARDIKLVELVRVLTGEAEKAFNEFTSRVADWNYKINANASTISLEHHIKRELDVDAVITELEGTPIDFLVTISGFVDENRLRVLIDSYKLAGRSYVFVAGSEFFSAKFSNWSCESLFEDNLLTVHFDTTHIWVTSAVAVGSDVVVSVRVDITGRPSQNKQVTIANAATESNHLTIVDGAYFIDISAAEVTDAAPGQDTFYNYTF